MLLSRYRNHILGRILALSLVLSATLIFGVSGASASDDGSKAKPSVSVDQPAGKDKKAPAMTLDLFGGGLNMQNMHLCTGSSKSSRSSESNCTGSN